MSSDPNPFKLELSHTTRKALSVHLGDSAGQEIADLLGRMASQIEELRKTKVNVTPVIPQAKAERSPLTDLDNEVL